MKNLQAFAEQLKTNATASELALKAELERLGLRFQFQKVLHCYIADFYFPQQKKLIELDGKQFHNPAKDRKRDAVLKSKGYITHRIRSYRVFSEMPLVIEEIKQFLFNAPVKRRKSKKARIKAYKRKLSKSSRPVRVLNSLHNDESYRDFLLKVGE